MQNFIFHNPTKIIFGKNTINAIGKEVKKSAAKKVLMLAGAVSIKNNSVYEQITASLKGSGIEWFELWGVKANPTLEHAQRAISIIKEIGIDAIVAAGGGSVIDEAKAVAAGVFVDDIWDAYLGKISISKALPIFTVLTISATGSEMNPTSVLSNEKAQKKLPLASQLLRPLASIIDPSVQSSLPWEQTVNGGIDILAHIFESYFAGSSQEVTIALNESLMKTVINCIDTLAQDEKNYSARANLAWTATLALNGISAAGIIGDWASHRIEHSISAVHTNIAHGTGLGVVFPAWIKYVYKENIELFQRWAKNIWNANSVEQAISLFQQKLKDWKAPTKLSELGIKYEELDFIASNSLETPTLGVVKLLNQNDVLEILKLAY